jgi:hypothetical protein
MFLLCALSDKDIELNRPYAALRREFNTPEEALEFGRSFFKVKMKLGTIPVSKYKKKSTRNQVNWA